MRNKQTIVAFVPSTRNCFGLCGTVQQVDHNFNDVPSASKLVLKNVYLTPDWEDPVRVAMMFGPEVKFTNDMFIDMGTGCSYNGAVMGGSIIKSWVDHRLYVSQVSNSCMPMSVSATRMSEVRREPIFSSVQLQLSIDARGQLGKYLTTETTEWQKIDHLAMTTTSTTTSTNWKNQSTMLKRMLCPVSTQSSGET